MKLLDEIVGLLSDQHGSLTEALLKTKVLLHKIGHQELVEWVNDELNGYPIDKDVPEYRVIPVRVVGTLQNVAYVYNDYALPVSHLSEEARKHFSSKQMRESIRVLEEFSVKPKGHLAQPISPEFYSKFRKALQNVWISNAWIQMEPTQVMHVVIEVRSRLLDFVLSLQDKLGGSESEADVRQVAETFDARAIFQNAVIGDNATFVLGDNNTTNIKNVVKTRRFQFSLLDAKRYGVDEEDITSLEGCIDRDSGVVDIGKRQFGPAVKGWMSKMFVKAVDTSWNVEIGIVCGLLTSALQAYYFS